MASEPASSLAPARRIGYAECTFGCGEVESFSVIIRPLSDCPDAVGDLMLVLSEN